MKQFLKIIRALLITTGIMAVIATFVTMMIWTRGLLGLVMIFSIIFYVVYDALGASK